MRAVVQRVDSAAVEVEGAMVGSVGKGLLVLLGVEKEDTDRDLEYLLDKVAGLRIFEDENEKMNLSALDIGAQMLVVSQFTLCADCSHGRRPSFTPAAPPKEANGLYEYFTSRLKEAGISRVENGVFGADMQVSLVNDGPVTIILNSEELS